MISFDEVCKRVEVIGYYATTELLYDIYNALILFEESSVNPGQDIYAICLEGPPGSGKTEYVQTYTKLANIIFNDVELVEYQCDATTGKTELYEDIHIGSAIRNDPDNVIIAGVIVEAIKKVNNGKKVVLFLDEYDKAREETDAFFYQFLQAGKINTTQHGNLQIKDEYKGNLQVILCKNDMRKELSDALSRRVEIVRLDYMKPSIFYTVAHRKLIEERENPVNDGLLNLVTLMYEKAYSIRDMYKRLPSCSEMLIALGKVDRLIKKANAPQNIIYNTIIKNMFKSLDDIATFESSLDRTENSDEIKLAELVRTMKENTVVSNEEIDLNTQIAEKVLVNENKKLVDKIQEAEALIETYKIKFAQMEKDRKKVIKDEIDKILLENGKLVSNTKMPDAIGIFEDESSHIKRGHNIFDLSDNNWTDVATLVRPNLSHNYVIGKLVSYASDLDIVIYENGILLQECGEQKLIVINDFDEKNNLQFRVLSSIPIVPSRFIQDIDYFTKFINECYASQPKTAKVVIDEVLDMNDYRLNIDTLVYNDSELPFDRIEDKVYHFEYKSDKPDQPDYLSMLKCENPEKALEISKRIMLGQSKVLKK